MWQLDRDNQCTTTMTTTQITCSGVPQNPWAFAKLLRRRLPLT
jgi:hypothetical protein